MAEVGLEYTNIFHNIKNVHSGPIEASAQSPSPPPQHIPQNTAMFTSMAPTTFRVSLLQKCKWKKQSDLSAHLKEKYNINSTKQELQNLQIYDLSTDNCFN